MSAGATDFSQKQAGPKGGDKKYICIFITNRTPNHTAAHSGSKPNSGAIPTTTGATKSLGDVIPELKGKVEGISIRVPTPNVSLVEFVFSSNKKLDIKKINDSFIKSSNSKLKNILDVSNKPLVSSDFNHNPHSAIVDLSLTKTVGVPVIPKLLLAKLILVSISLINSLLPRHCSVSASVSPKFLAIEIIP